MSNVDITKLIEQASALEKLINDTQAVLGGSRAVSGLADALEKGVSDNSAKVAYVMSKYANGDPRKTVFVLAGGALAWVTAKTIDVVRNSYAKSEAKTALLGYYQQLVSKQNMISEAKDKTIKALEQATAELSEDNEECKKRIEALKKRQAELTGILNRIESMRRTVEV